MIYLGADHGGYDMKEDLKAFLRVLGYEYEDVGAEKFDPMDDYPDFAYKVAKKVSENPEKNRGVLLCRSGIGMDIVANKIKNVHCAQVFTEEMARKSREHNNTNVLSIATDYMKPDHIKDIVKIWLQTPFSGEERHVRRLEKLRGIEKEL